MPANLCRRGGIRRILELRKHRLGRGKKYGPLAQRQLGAVRSDPRAVVLAIQINVVRSGIRLRLGNSFPQDNETARVFRKLQMIVDRSELTASSQCEFQSRLATGEPAGSPSQATWRTPPARSIAVERLDGAACRSPMASIRLLFPTAFGPIRTFNSRSSMALSLKEKSFCRVNRLINIGVVLNVSEFQESAEAAAVCRQTTKKLANTPSGGSWCGRSCQQSPQDFGHHFLVHSSRTIFSAPNSLKTQAFQIHLFSCKLTVL